MPKIILRSSKSGRVVRGRKNSAERSRVSKSLAGSVLYHKMYCKDTTELDKAIATLRNGKKTDLRAKYKEYLDKCHA